MDTFELILKQMRQRALSTWLTLLSVTLGVALAIAILIVQREGNKLLGQTEYGYDLILGAKGSKLQLVMNTVYQLDQSPGNIPYAVYATLPERHPGAYRWAVPTAVGDQFKGFRIVATLPKLFDTPETRKPFEDLQQLIERQRQHAIAMQQAMAGNADLAALRAELGAIVEAGETIAGEARAIDEEAEAGIRRAVESLKQAAAALETPTRAAAADVVEPLKQARRQLLASGPLLGIFQLRPDRTLQIAEGRAFGRLRFESVIGAEVAEKTGLQIGDTFKAEHGVGPTSGADDHDHNEQWTVVGILSPTHTAMDRVIFTPLATFYAIPAHEEALVQMATVRGVEDEPPPATAPAADPWGEGFSAGSDHEHPYFLSASGDIILELPKEKWKLSGVLISSRGAAQGQQIAWAINNGPDAMAVVPAREMQVFFDTFLAGTSRTLLLLSVLVTIVAAVSILVSIYNSIAARRREIAILRALGATRVRVLTLVCLEAGLIGLFGALLGWVAGHALAAAGSIALRETIGESISWFTVGGAELGYLAGVVVLAVLAGLVPALKAYQTPVAANLAAE